VDMGRRLRAEPSYAQLLLAMQKRVHDYVVADKGTAKEALDCSVLDWDEGVQGGRKDEIAVSSAVVVSDSPRLRPRGLICGCVYDASMMMHPTGTSARQGRARHARAVGAARPAACPIARSRGCSSLRRSFCCSRSTSFR